MAHPARWGVFETSHGYEVLPQLGKLKLDPGCNGVTNSGNYDAALTHATRGGWTVLEHDCVPGGYVRQYDTEKGLLHLSVWEHPKMSGGRPIIATDEAGHHAFLRWVAAEVLPPPDPELLERIRSIQAARRARQIETAQRNPARADAIAETDIRIEAVTAKLAETPEAPAKPVKRGKKVVSHG
jgi:hypothetical protein